MSRSGDSSAPPLALHASAVALGACHDFGVLIEGPSGSGKSALALQLIALGGCLVADDRVRLALRDGTPHMLAPERLEGVIEARGLGLIRVPHLAAAPLRLVVDMGAVEPARLPEPAWRERLGARIRYLRRVDGPHFAGSIVALSNGEWWHDD